MSIVRTVGHSTRSADEFIKLLQAYELQAVADVRRHPGSRRLPQFDQDALAEQLANVGIAYQWFPALGGRRRAHADSIDTGQRNESFRAYADHLQSEVFSLAGRDLQLCERARTTLMCAEAVWWRCHRRLIADVLCMRGIEFIHIFDVGRSVRHSIVPPARIVDGYVIKPRSVRT